MHYGPVSAKPSLHLSTARTQPLLPHSTIACKLGSRLVRGFRTRFVVQQPWQRKTLTPLQTSADIQQGAVDLLIQMARYDIESSPTRADNLIEEAKGFIYDEDGIKDFFTARVLSSASYNLGGITQRSCGRPDGLAVRFFKRACTLGRDALQRFPNDEAAKELQAQMANRWGVLANALLHIGDRKVRKILSFLCHADSAVGVLGSESRSSSCWSA